MWTPAPICAPTTGVGGSSQDDLWAKEREAGPLLALGSIPNVRTQGEEHRGEGWPAIALWVDLDVSFPSLVMACVDSPQRPPSGCFQQAPKPAWFFSYSILLTLRRLWVKLFVFWECSRRSRAPSTKQDSCPHRHLGMTKKDKIFNPLWTASRLMIRSTFTVKM